jgi:hypothetical protein
LLTNTPGAVILTIGTATVTPFGTFPLTISPNTTGAPAAKTRTSALTITAIADYSLISIIRQGRRRRGAKQPGSMVAVNGYNSAVSLSCGASLTPIAAGAPFSVSLSSTQVQNYTFNIVAQGSHASTLTDSAAVTFNSAFDFSVVPSVASQTVKAGQTANYNLDFVPAGGTFPTAVTLGCTGAPPRSICTLNPAQIASGTGETAVVLAVATTAPIASSQPFS